MTTIWYADGADAPRSDPATVLAAAGVPCDGPVEVSLGWTVERPAWLDELDPMVAVRTTMAGYGLAGPIADGRVRALPVRLGAVPGLIESAPPEVAVVTGVRRGGALAFSSTVGYGDVLARRAARVVVEVGDTLPDLGGPEIEGNVVATLARPGPNGAASVTSRPADVVDLRIGELVASLLPDDATLQFGPGGIGEGIARSIDRPVRIWSGLVTDAMASLADRGLLAAPAVGAYAWGGAPIERLAGDGMLRLASCTATHDIGRLAAIGRFVGCNTAVQVGLDGAVNVERVGDRVIAGIGGHPDFCAGASRSVGGVSVVALRSTTARGASTVVHRVANVSTPRCDVDVVVTEHGIADLRGRSDGERAERLIAVAAPEHRDELDRATR